MIKTKIIATLGPASSHETVLRKMFAGGLDVVRLNFSHGTHQDHIRNIETVRRLNRKMRRAIKIMQDLEGYRMRIGKLEAPVELKKRQTLFLTQAKIIGNPEEVSFDYDGALKVFKAGTLIYIDDGRIVLEVLALEPRRLKVHVRVPGLLKEHKGINIPGIRLNFVGLTEKDRADVKIANHYKLDYVAQSFVRNARDLKMLREIVKPHHPDCRIIAKVENQEALRNLDSIIEHSDGIMVARGDMGICVPIYRVPVIQKEIVNRCRLKHKPVIVATQMLESMVEEDIPTRAEVSDVANAVLDGATHVMLSAETAVGKRPDHVVSMMNQIIKYTEAHQKKVARMKA